MLVRIGNFTIGLNCTYKKFLLKTSLLLFLRNPILKQTELSKKYDPDRSTERSSSGKFGLAYRFSWSDPDHSGLIPDQLIPEKALLTRTIVLTYQRFPKSSYRKIPEVLSKDSMFIFIKGCGVIFYSLEDGIEGRSAL